MTSSEGSERSGSEMSAEETQRIAAEAVPADSQADPTSSVEHTFGGGGSSVEKVEDLHVVSRNGAILEQVVDAEGTSVMLTGADGRVSTGVTVTDSVGDTAMRTVKTETVTTSYSTGPAAERMPMSSVAAGYEYSQYAAGQAKGAGVSYGGASVTTSYPQQQHASKFIASGGMSTTGYGQTSYLSSPSLAANRSFVGTPAGGYTTVGGYTSTTSGSYPSPYGVGSSSGYVQQQHQYSQQQHQYGQQQHQYGQQYGQQTVQSERIVSSNVLGEQWLGQLPQEENIQYVEVPVIEEVIKTVPKKEYVEIEKRVPRIEVEWVERVVEVPQVHVVDKQVEVPQIQEVVRHVPVRQVVEVPREVVRTVPKIETRIVEKEVEVPGEIIEVPKPYLVENKVIVPRYSDKEVATVVSQRLVPVIAESETEYVDVDLKEYNPYLVPVDVYVPKPVARHLVAAGKTEEHRVVDIPIGQFNALIRQVNTHITEKDLEALYVREAGGAVPVMPSAPGSLVVAPTSNEWKAQHSKGVMHYSATCNTGPVNPPVVVGGGISTTTGGLISSTGNVISSTGGVISSGNVISSTGGGYYGGGGVLTSSGGHYTTSGGMTSTSAGGYQKTTSVYGDRTTSTYPSGQMVSMGGSHYVGSPYNQTQYNQTQYGQSQYGQTQYGQSGQTSYKYSSSTTSAVGRPQLVSEMKTSTVTGGSTPVARPSGMLQQRIIAAN